MFSNKIYALKYIKTVVAAEYNIALECTSDNLSQLVIIHIKLK